MIHEISTKVCTTMTIYSVCITRTSFSKDFPRDIQFLIEKVTASLSGYIYHQTSLIPFFFSLFNPTKSSSLPKILYKYRFCNFLTKGNETSAMNL